MKLNKLPIVALALAFTAAPLLGIAEEDEVELDESQLYFELNDTDGDLGIHGKADGDAWRRMRIEGPRNRRLLDIRTRSRLTRQGLTELFFESAEPTFDELDPETFFNRFPEGLYEWEGLTVDREDIEGEMFLSHRIPAAPVVASVGEEFAPQADECWDPGDVDEVLIDWHAVTHTHASLGSDTNAPLGDNAVIYYEFVVEIDDTDFKATALVPPDVTEWTVSEAFIQLAESLTVEDEDTGLQVPVDEIKFEIIVRVETGEVEDDDGETVDSAPGNQSAVESCFEI
ncbi:MAG: hypothetical protein HKN50_12970 [Gammaproteobacteria bacterium]|nr:hypothetical protein [Gammaproteobacteria bacterium]